LQSAEAAERRQNAFEDERMAGQPVRYGHIIQVCTTAFRRTAGYDCQTKNICAAFADTLTLRDASFATSSLRGTCT